MPSATILICILLFLLVVIHAGAFLYIFLITKDDQTRLKDVINSTIPRDLFKPYAKKRSKLKPKVNDDEKEWMREHDL